MTVVKFYNNNIINNKTNNNNQIFLKIQTLKKSLLHSSLVISQSRRKFL